MAASGALNDFARMPTERKALVFVVIGGLLGLIYFQLVFKSLNSQLDDARTEHESKLATSAQLTNDIPKYDIERTRMKKLKETIDENQKALPTETELPAFYEMLNRKILESGVELANWSQDPEQPVETFVKQAQQACHGRVVVFTFHGVPDMEHPSVGLEPATFKVMMQYLKDNHYQCFFAAKEPGTKYNCPGRRPDREVQV